MESCFLPQKINCVYTSHYCEENVWHLCSHLRSKSLESLQSCFVVFISNSNRQIPLWAQKAGDAPEHLVVWDYHVIFVHKSNDGQSLVYDLDCVLDFPSTFEEYFDAAIMDNANLKENFHRKFRVINASIFLNTFASNRSHMRSPEGGWLAPPPQYPCIQTNNSNTIELFISMDPGVGWGDVLDSESFYQMFRKDSSVSFDGKQTDAE